MKFAQWNLFAGLLLLGASGCAEPPLEYTEVRRIEEQITDQEVKSYLALAQRFPEQMLPDFPAVYAPPADWSPTRTMHVNELVTEELKLIIENWDVELLAQKLEKNKELQQHLKELRMTPQQYVGLTLALGTAYGRLLLRDDQDLKKVVDEGDREIGELKKINHPFASLREEQFSILKRAVWLTRQNRAEQLLQVPAENIQLVKRYRDALQKSLPRQFTLNPLDEVADLLLEKGLPFEIIENTNGEDEITWTTSHAIVGNDMPDKELTNWDDADPSPTAIAPQDAESVQAGELEVLPPPGGSNTLPEQIPIQNAVQPPTPPKT